MKSLLLFYINANTSVHKWQHLNERKSNVKPVFGVLKKDTNMKKKAFDILYQVVVFS